MKGQTFSLIENRRGASVKIQIIYIEQTSIIAKSILSSERREEVTNRQRLISSVDSTNRRLHDDGGKTEGEAISKLKRGS